MALAEWLLGQRARTRLISEGEGPVACQRFGGNLQRLGDVDCVLFARRFTIPGRRRQRRPSQTLFRTGTTLGPPAASFGLSSEDVSATFPDRSPNRFARFWVDQLPAASIKRFSLGRDSVEEPTSGSTVVPAVKIDEQGWPTSATWPGMTQPLFISGLGDFVSAKVNAFAPRWALQDIWGTGDPAQRAQLQKATLEFVTAKPAGRVTVEDGPHTIRFTQALEHPRLKWVTRRLSSWKAEPRARLTVRLNRLSSFDPELLCIVNPLPCDGTLPRLSSGGMDFTPFTDQFPGTCRDYFAIDGWGGLRDARRALAVGHAAMPAHHFGRTAPQVAPHRTTRPHWPRARHCLRQLLVHQFPGGQPRGDGVSI